jgi:hypothetical protein
MQDYEGLNPAFLGSGHEQGLSSCLIWEVCRLYRITAVGKVSGAEHMECGDTPLEIFRGLWTM